MGPCFEASAPHMEVSESTFCLQLHFECYASGPLGQNNSPAKSVLDVVQSFNVVFSSDRSVDRFTGKPYSSLTGLYYSFRRWYDPSIGRYISQDPIGGQLSDPQSHNRYVYVSNLPTVLTDPSGLAYMFSVNNLCWNWGTWRYEACGPSPSQSSGVMSVGEPPTGISSGSGAGPGAALFVGAVIIADLALWGLDTLVGYLRTPPTTTTLTGKDVNPPTTIPTPRDPAVFPGPPRADGIRMPGPWPAVSPAEAGGAFPANNLRSWVRKAFFNPTVHKICAGSALAFGVAAYFYEDLQSAKQGLPDRPDIEAIVGSVAAICYAAAGFLLSVPH